MASDTVRLSRWCLAAFAFGLTSFLFGMLSLALWPDDYLRFCLLFALLTLLTAFVGVIETSRQEFRPRGYLLALWGLCFPGVFYLLMLLRIGEESRYRVNRSETTNRLKQIGLALHNYNDVVRQLPPAAIRDAA